MCVYKYKRTKVDVGKLLDWSIIKTSLFNWSKISISNTCDIYDNLTLILIQSDGHSLHSELNRKY